MEIQRNPDGTPYLLWGDHKLELETSEVTEKFYKEKAQDELRETPEVVENALKELRKLLESEKDLVIPVESDAFLMKFLRPCKFYPQSALKKIQNFYKFKINQKHYAHDIVPSSVRPAFESSVVSILSPRDQHGRRILLIDSGERSGQSSLVQLYIHGRYLQKLKESALLMQASGDEKWNHKEVPLAEVFRGLQLALEAALVEERTQICGVVVLFDLKGLSLSQVMQFTPSFAKMAVDWIQDSAPIRIKAVHLVFQPYVFNMVFAIFKPFLSQKLRSRIYFHGSNLGSFHGHVDKKSLRKRHGGLLPNPEPVGELLADMLMSYEERFQIANSYGYTKKK